ncbi:MAG: hypothetical protein E7672_04195 [Ruminococcaceae bacterium]|nr:hypothetical protein [Oscillospiraceae bacterium]
MFSDTIKILNKKNVKIIAHRGCSGLETENTASAFVAAGNRTYYGIETDIYRTSDGKLICHHDRDTGRICDINLKIEDTPYDTLRSLTLNDTDGAADRSDLRLCSLEEYIKICKKYNKHAVLELKSNFQTEELQRIVGIFKEFDYLHNMTFISFDIRHMVRLRSFLPDQSCQYLTMKWDDDLPKRLAELNVDLDIMAGLLDEERVKLLHDYGIKVNCWTVDDPQTAETLIEMGVDQITTNILE